MKIFTFLGCLRRLNTDRQKEGQNEPRGLPKWSPKRSPGPPGRVKSRLEIPPEAPRKITMVFFRPREPPGASWEPPGEAPGAHLAPKRAPEASRSHFGTQNGAKMQPPGLILGVFLDTSELCFGQLRPALFHASRLCTCSACASGCQAHRLQEGPADARSD